MPVCYGSPVGITSVLQLGIHQLYMQTHVHCRPVPGASFEDGLRGRGGAAHLVRSVQHSTCLYLLVTNSGLRRKLSQVVDAVAFHLMDQGACVP